MIRKRDESGGPAPDRPSKKAANDGTERGRGWSKRGAHHMAGVLRGWDHHDDHHRGRMRRGDVRTAVLIALADGPAHGYELIQTLDAKTDGRWRPSPGSVYPALQLLTDEGLVRPLDHDGKRSYEITDEGRAKAADHVERFGYPWDAIDRGGEYGDLRSAMKDLHLAIKQVGLVASPEVAEHTAAILVQARKDIYRLLAEA